MALTGSAAFSVVGTRRVRRETYSYAVQRAGVYRTWFAIGLAGLLGGVAVVSLFVGFGSPVFLVVAAVSATGGFLAYRYARERMLASVYAGVETGHGAANRPTDDADDADTAGQVDADGAGGGDGPRSRDRATQATDGGETAADYDEWTWAGSDPDDPFWSDDPEDWEDPWEWEATDPEDAGADGWRRGSGAGERTGSGRWSGWSAWTGGGGDETDDEREHGRRDDRTAPEDRGRGPTVEEAYEALGLEPGADLEAVREAYRERAKETHPDLGGDPEAFIRVREAYERLRERLDDAE